MPPRLDLTNKKSGIYSIIHIDSNRRYIGSAVNIEKRLWRHKSDLRKNKHHNHHLQNAWNKYGEIAFLFLIVENVNNISDLIRKEQKHINSYQRATLFNHSFVAGSVLGMKHSDKAKQLISIALTGIKKSKEASVIQTRLEKETIEKLKHVAKKQERTVSALIRFVLKNYLQRKK